MIIGIDLRTLRNSEFLRFVNDFAALIDAHNPVALDVAAQQESFKAKIAESVPLSNQERASSLTPRLRLLDKRRDKALKGIGFAVKSYRYHYDDQYVKSANLLATHLRQFGKNISRQTSQAKTTTITKIIGEWETNAKFIASMARLSLNVWVAELKTANQLFHQKFLERTQEYSTANTDNMKVKREEIVATYYELRKFLNANIVIRSNADYEKAINELNALIEPYNVLLTARRKPRNKNVEIQEPESENV